MSARKATVEHYIEGFRRSDHEAILSCLTDKVRWDMPGFFHLQGKEAFDAAIENDAGAASPTITIDRLFEDGDAVVAVGAVTAPMKDGTTLDAVFCDVFTFVEDKIDRLETFQVTLSEEHQDRAKLLG